MAFHKVWAIILPTFEGLGTSPKLETRSWTISPRSLRSWVLAESNMPRKISDLASTTACSYVYSYGLH